MASPHTTGCRCAIFEAFAAAAPQSFGRRQLTPSTLRHSISHVGPTRIGAGAHCALHVHGPWACSCDESSDTVTPCTVFIWMNIIIFSWMFRWSLSPTGMILILLLVRLIWIHSLSAVMLPCFMSHGFSVWICTFFGHREQWKNHVHSRSHAKAKFERM